jgi:hypothetical protein
MAAPAATHFRRLLGVSVSVATLEAIRDRAYTLVEAIVPTSLTRDTFRRYRNEGAADFRDFAEKTPAGALRRFQIRENAEDDPPLVSDTINERVRTVLELLVAYPQNSRTGNANAMDRDDVMNQDWKSINALLGLYGRGNFSSGNDCVTLGCVKSVEHGAGVDFLVVRMSIEYLRAIA